MTLLCSTPHCSGKRAQPCFREDLALFSCCLCSLARRYNLLGVEVVSTRAKSKEYEGKWCCLFPSLDTVMQLSKKKKKHLCCSAWERIGGVSLAVEPVPEGTVME